MGQQQLLLLVLSTVIVGLATVAGIQAFDRTLKRTSVNRITEKSVQIASDVQEYVKRPDILRRENTTGDNELVVDFGELSNYETNDASGDGDHVGRYATYSLNGHGTLPEGYNEDARPDNSPVNTVEAYSEEHDVSVCVSITGTSADDLKAGVAK